MFQRVWALTIATALCISSYAFATDDVVFRRGSTMYIANDGKSKAAIVRVSPSAGTVTVLDKKSGDEVSQFTREAMAATSPELRGVVYTFGKKFRTKTVVGLTVVCFVCGIATMFNRSKWHWITIQNDAKIQVLRAPKRDYERMRLQISAALGVPLEIAEGG